MGTVLGPDMLTIKEGPVNIAPSQPYSKGSSFEGHEFFEAPSIRKKGDTYYFIYSSVAMVELCYATSKSPMKDFVYGGVIVSNNDCHMDTYKPAEKPMSCLLYTSSRVLRRASEPAEYCFRLTGKAFGWKYGTDKQDSVFFFYGKSSEIEILRGIAVP